MGVLEETVRGRAPQAVLPNGDRRAQGPFGYASSPGGLSGSVGAGFLSGQMGPARGDALSAQGHFGQWTGENGGRNVGVAAEAGVARVGMPTGGPLGPLGFDGELLTANANVSANDETSTVGAGANIAAGALTLGNDDRSLRVGGAFGVGVAGRAHYGDADADGHPEYGIGVDIGPLSVDVKDEKFGHMWDDVQWAAGAATNAFRGVYGSMGQHAGPIPEGSPMDYNLF